MMLLIKREDHFSMWDGLFHIECDMDRWETCKNKCQTKKKYMMWKVNVASTLRITNGKRRRQWNETKLMETNGTTTTTTPKKLQTWWYLLGIVEDHAVLVMMFWAWIFSHLPHFEIPLHFPLCSLIGHGSHCFHFHCYCWTMRPAQLWHHCCVLNFCLLRCRLMNNFERKKKDRGRERETKMKYKHRKIEYIPFSLLENEKKKCGRFRLCTYPAHKCWKWVWVSEWWGCNRAIAKAEYGRMLLPNGKQFEHTHAIKT